MWILANFSPKRHVYPRNHVVWCIIRGSRKMRLTCRLVREKKGGEESHKSLTNGHRVGAPPLNRPPIFFSPIECAPRRGHPCQIWFWSVDAFVYVPQGVEIRVFPILCRTAHTTVLCTNVQRCDNDYDVIVNLCRPRRQPDTWLHNDAIRYLGLRFSEYHVS